MTREELLKSKEYWKGWRSLKRWHKSLKIRKLFNK